MDADDIRDMDKAIEAANAARREAITALARVTSALTEAGLALEELGAVWADNKPPVVAAPKPPVEHRRTTPTGDHCVCGRWWNQWANQCDLVTIAQRIENSRSKNRPEFCGLIHNPTGWPCELRKDHSGDHHAYDPTPEGGDWTFTDADVRR